MSKRRWVLIGVVAGCVAVAILLVLVLVPLPHNFTLHDQTLYDPIICHGPNFPQGPTVSFQWSAASGISFGVHSCSSGLGIYRANGTSGSGTFVSQGGAYGFGTLCAEVQPPACAPANVTGSSSAPILRL